MENLKIKVGSEGRQEQELFFYLGYSWQMENPGDFYGVETGWIYANKIHMVLYAGSCKDEEYKEITIHQLKDMVILKRNDVRDATHKYHGCDFYIDSDKCIYQFMNTGWFKDVEGNLRYDDISRFPIQKPQVEYLIKVAGEYTLVTGDSVPEGGIEVPDGADTATQYGDFFIFWKGDIESFSRLDGDEKWVSGGDNMPLSEYMTHFENSIVWHRHAQDESKVSDNAWDIQVGGNHYKDMKIQPAQFAMENNLDYLQGNAIKYICRHKSKNGLQDLEKAKHYIELMIEHHYK